MALTPLDFSDETFRRVSICAFLDDQETVRRYKELPVIDWDAQDNASRWYHLAISISQRHTKDGTKERLHLHIDAVRAFDRSKSPASHELKQLGDELAKLNGTKFSAHIAGEYRIPRADLPKLGIIMSMSGIATTASGEKLSLAGATMAFDQEPFDELEWKYRGDDVMVVLDADKELVVSENALIESVSLLREGIKKFVLESTEGVAHGEE